MTLPAWVNPRASRLLAELIENPPARFIVSAQACNPAHEKFNALTSRSFAELRRIRRDWWEANYETATSYVEDADDLLSRLIGEQRLTEVRGDPFPNEWSDAA